MVFTGDQVKLLAAGISRGLQDAVWGMLSIPKLDTQPTPRDQTPTNEQRSTLAKRRLQHQPETQPDKTNSKNTKQVSVQERIIRCCAWNGGIFWLSIIVFNRVIMPCLQAFTETLFLGSANKDMIWSNLAPLVGWTFSALWVLPLFVLSKIVNSLWFQDIADAAYRRSRGRPVLHSLSMMIADILFSLLLQALFLLQGTVATLLPIRGLGEIVGLLHFCLLYAVYAFEYKWFNMGWAVHKRLSYVEVNWPYFLGFGLPLAVLTTLPQSYVVSGCVFSILFPLFIISANEAEPITQLYCNCPLRLFSPVIYLTNAICARVIGDNKQMTDNPARRYTDQTQ